MEHELTPDENWILTSKQDRRSMKQYFGDGADNGDDRNANI